MMIFFLLLNLLIPEQNLFYTDDKNSADTLLVYDLLQQKAKNAQIKIFTDPLLFHQPNTTIDIEYLTTQDLNGLLSELIRAYSIQTIFFEPNYLVILKAHQSSLLHSHVFIPEKDKIHNPHHPVINPSLNYTLSGSVIDGTQSEPIIGATVFIDELKTGTITNPYGYFSITLPSGFYTITFGAIGYEKRSLPVILSSDSTVSVTLFNKSTQLEEIIIRDEAEDHNVSSMAIGVNRLNIKELRQIPPLFGEVDIIRNLVMLPGVTTVGEGSSGFNVRGGSVDQNLILLEDAPIFNSSHLFGFFSSFNSNAIKDVTLYKGGMPAQYGGRISSVLDIKVKPGNSKMLRMLGGAGVLTSHITIDGPIRNDQSTFVLSGRITYSDWYLKLLPDVYLQNSSAYFHDFMGKISHRINPKNFLSLTAYTSMDRFGFPGDTTYGWSNHILSLKWTTNLHPKFLMSNSLIYSGYLYNVYNEYAEKAFTWKAGINFFNFKSDYTKNWNYRNQSEAGISIIYYHLDMGTLQPGHPESYILPQIISPGYGTEWAIYLSHIYHLNSRFSLMGGARYSTYILLGPGSVNTYMENMPLNSGTLTGQITYKKNESIVQYGGLEPRFSATYHIKSNSSLKINYNRTQQYLHLISNTSAVSPMDIWKLSDPYIKPQTGDQVSIGYFQNFRSNMFESSAELYFKHIHHIIDYKDGAELLLNPRLESDLTSGILHSYGLELFLKKSKGRFTGWISYTLSRSQRKTENDFPEETINKGMYYPINYDKLHDLGLTGNYQFTRRHSFGFNFVVNSGRPITYPFGSYFYGTYIIPNYELRNQERTPAYHRLDISFTVDGSHKRTNRWHGSWTFSIYNLYGRDNPYSVFFKAVGFKLPQAYQLAVIGIPVPSITYHFRFE